MKTESVAFYNVENLFDIWDDAYTADDDYTPNGKKLWDETKYNHKIHKIASVFDLWKSHYNQLPFLVGLSEVENKLVLKDLVSEISVKTHQTYDVIHYDSLDERGIDVSLLYDAKKFLPTSFDYVRFNLTNEDGSKDFTRDVLYVNGMYFDELLHIYVLHLPSKREEDINKDKRIYILNEIRKLIDTLHEQYESPSILLLGDFNENPSTKYLVDSLNAESTIEETQPNQLYNPFIELYRNKNYSVYHKDQGLLFDQIILSKSFLYKNATLQFDSAFVFNEYQLQEWDKRYAGRPFRSFVGKKYLGGYSDHFPIGVQFKIT